MRQYAALQCTPHRIQPDQFNQRPYMTVNDFWMSPEKNEGNNVLFWFYFVYKNNYLVYICFTVLYNNHCKVDAGSALIKSTGDDDLYILTNTSFYISATKNNLLCLRISFAITAKLSCRLNLYICHTHTCCLNYHRSSHPSHSYTGILHQLRCRAMFHSAGVVEFLRRKLTSLRSLVGHNWIWFTTYPDAFKT